MPTAIWPEGIDAASLGERLPALLAEALPPFLPDQRWFGEKSGVIERVETVALAIERLGPAWLALAVERVILRGSSADYFLPLLVLPGEEAIRPIALLQEASGAVWTVADAPPEPAFQAWLANAASSSVVTRPGFAARWAAVPGGARALQEARQSPSRLLSGEQSNSNVAYGDAALIKVFRRVQPGLNPDVELGRYLTEEAGYTHIPALLGDWELAIGDQPPASIGLAQALVPNTGDGWTRILAALDEARDEERRAAIAADAELLGRRTGELHLALAAGTSAELAPEPITDADAKAWRDATAASLAATMADLASLDHSRLDDRTARLVAQVLAQGPALASWLDGYERLVGYRKTRVHGDYHLGQTLRRPDGDWVLLDFEGEPARSLAERRAKTSPLKDVAGMQRSLAYARAFAAQQPGAWTDPERRLERAFLAGYRAALAGSESARIAPAGDDEFVLALRPWVLDKALYEIAYERNNRPAWLWAPLEALLNG